MAQKMRSPLKRPIDIDEDEPIKRSRLDTNTEEKDMNKDITSDKEDKEGKEENVKIKETRLNMAHHIMIVIVLTNHITMITLLFSLLDRLIVYETWA
jgi:uncharacterized membrane protein